MLQREKERNEEEERKSYLNKSFTAVSTIFKGWFDK